MSHWKEQNALSVTVTTEVIKMARTPTTTKITFNKLTNTL
jgi:hypothetical protein